MAYLRVVLFPTEMFSGLVFYTVFHIEDKQPFGYKKVKATLAKEGQIFEYKFCALTYIKAIKEGLNFELGLTLKGFEFLMM
jgi:hypothetical protein